MTAAPRRLAGAALMLVLLLSPLRAAAQEDPHAGMSMPPVPAGQSWSFMQDAVVFVMLDDQGSPRGGTGLRAPNWWMGMATRRIAGGTLAIRLMLSADPATVGAHGYGEIFQIGETYQGNALIDRQHPHDFLMQAAAIWRRPLADRFALTLAGAPVGEPALGPVAFMHRASAADNPMAPLGHHTLDSTHIAMGVLTAGVDRGPLTVETSLFRGAEPDEQRWDLMDPGPLDSWSVRGWYRPTPEWSFQVSHGYLTKPDALEDGDVRRTTASAAWRRQRANGSTAVTLAWGRNQKIGGRYNAYLAELTEVRGRTTLFTRIEATNVEDDVLRTGVHEFQGGRKTSHVVLPGRIEMVGAVTLGATRTIWRPRGWDVAGGAAATTYGVPPGLTPFYDVHPWSFQIFSRIRPPAMHRMTDMIMTNLDR